MLPLVLVITADRIVSEPFRHELGGAGFKAYYVESLASALGVLGQWRFDAVLVHGRGFDHALHGLLGELQRSAAAPVLLVLDDADEDRQLRALDAGASQLVVEPASMRFVAAQLRRLIDVSQRRLEQHSSEIRFGALCLDPRRATASVGGRQLALTTGEFELLLLLASPPGELVHRHTIALTMGHLPDAGASRGADMHVCRIRRKLKEAGGHGLVVETVYGRGYRLRLFARPRDADAELDVELDAEPEPDAERRVAWSV